MTFLFRFVMKKVSIGLYIVKSLLWIEKSVGVSQASYFRKEFDEVLWPMKLPAMDPAVQNRYRLW